MVDKFGFPLRLKLRKAIDYKKVFLKPIKSTDRFFTLLVRKNDYSYSRLGLVIAKKNIKKAVTRNLIKRLVRENFRLQQYLLKNMDIIVLARADAVNASPILLKKSLNKHWLKLINRCN